MSRYLVQGRSGNLFAIMRRGPKGGLRLIGVWRSYQVANRICDLLNSWIEEEA